jgi:hypothetical protein
MQSELIFVICPGCKKPNPSGFAATYETLADPKNPLKSKETICAHCNCPILWSKAELLPLSEVMTRVAPPRVPLTKPGQKSLFR